MRVLAALTALLFTACGHAAPTPAPEPKTTAPDAAPTALPDAAPPAKPAGPPSAKVDPVTESQFGISWTDPYRWMETDEAGLTQFMIAQGTFTNDWLSKLPGRDKLLARIRELGLASSGPGAVELAGDRTFYRYTAPDAELSVLIVREHGKDRVLVDPSTIGTADQHAAINAWAPSPDGKRLAYDVSLGGGEISDLHVLDVVTGKDLPDVVPRVWGQFSARWLPDGKGFFYPQMPVTKDGEDPWKGWVVKLHMLGDAPEKDPAILAGASSPSFALEPQELPDVTIQRGTKWVFAIGLGAFSWKRVAVARLDRLDRSGKAATNWTVVATYDDKVEDFWIHGDRIYLKTFKDAGNRKIVSVPIAKPDLAKAKVEVAEEKDTPLVDESIAKDATYLLYMDKGLARVTRRPWKGKSTELALPYPGWVDLLATDPLRDGVVLDVEGWTQPSAYYAYDVKAKKLTPVGLATQATADYSNVIAEEVEATSADGTMVPLSILHQKDAPLDGSHPAILYAYGGYGIPMTPHFDPTLLAWLERGGVWSVCHVRGGGEKGFQWQADGSKEHKMNGIYDLEACGQYLIDHHFTSSARLFAHGESMGGVLMGRALTDRPDLFAAFNIGVGIVNPLRILAAANGANQVTELGDPSTEDGYKSIYAMDPYVHIEDGTAYPAVLFSSGLNDHRVVPWMMAKMAARLQVASTSGKPVLLRVDTDSGHGAGSTRDQGFTETADRWAFDLAVAGDPEFTAPSGQ